jgi:hypothetical protein
VALEEKGNNTMKMISIFCCLSLGIGIAKAQTQPACPSTEPIARAWYEAGRERAYNVLEKLGISTDAFSFPEPQLQPPNSYINNGELICEYRYGVSEPFVRINMGKLTTGKAEEKGK